MSALIGQTLDQYRLVEQVGQGGMATVYRAVDARTLQELAVKVLSPTIGSEKRFVRRFRREAGLVSRLNHPNIVPVIGYGESHGYVYLAMPFIAGDTLQDRMTRKRLNEAETVRWIVQVGAALEFAHRKGIIHRDVKPSNILIDAGGNALLTDFGLARVIEGSSTLTGSLLMGTPAYVSPEQARGDRIDARADQYSVGVILYQIATGSLPFEGETPMVTALKHIQEAVPLPRYANPEITPEIEAVILKTLAKDPARRFASMQDLTQAYQLAAKGKLPPGVALPSALTTQLGEVPRVPARLRQRRGGRPVLTGFVFAVTGVALVLAAVLAYPSLVARLRPGGTPEATLPPQATLPGLLPTSPQASATAVLAATPTPVESAACPGLRLTNFDREGSAIFWTMDNGRGAALRLTNVVPGGPLDNPPIEISVGGQAVWSIPAGTTPEAETSIEIPVELATVASISTRQFLMRYNWEDAAWEGGSMRYSLDLIFEGGCTLNTAW